MTLLIIVLGQDSHEGPALRGRRIVLDSTKAGPGANGLMIRHGCGRRAVDHLSIQRLEGNGILIDGRRDNKVGGTDSASLALQVLLCMFAWCGLTGLRAG